MPTYDQCREVWRHKISPITEQLAGKLGVVTKQNNSELYLEFYNGSYINLKTIGNEQNLRGRPVDLYIGDEFAYYPAHVFPEIIAPMLANSRNRRAILISTPTGKDLFYDYFMTGTPGTPNYNPLWRSFTGTVAMRNNANYSAFIESQRAFVPENIFRSQWEAEFLDNNGQVFVHVDDMFTLSNYAQPTARNYAGIDLAFTNDRTVLIILNELGQCVYFKRYELVEQANQIEMVQHIADTLKRFPNTHTLIEDNFNPIVSQALSYQHGVRNINRWKTTNDNKTDYITSLRYGIIQNELAFPTRKEFKDMQVLSDELLNYQTGQTEKKKLLSFSAPHGKHDDTVIALALAYKILRHNVRVSSLAA